MALLILQTCAEVTAIVILAWKYSLPYRISPAQEAAMEATGGWLSCAFLTASITAGWVMLMLRRPACRTAYLWAWAAIATLVLIVVFMVAVFAPEIHGVSHKPPNVPPRSLDRN